MIDETDLREEKAWWYRCLGEKAVHNLRRRNLTADFVPTAAEALPRIMGLIPEGATVGWGDSATLYQLGVFQELHRTRPGLVIDALHRDDNGVFVNRGPQRYELMRKAMTADVFLSGINAVAADGRLVNVDATGNRVAPTIFGPRMVIMVAGANKIVDNLEEALDRAKQAAAINARRHINKHNSADRFGDLPCVRTGQCADCTNVNRICRFTVVIEGERPPGFMTDFKPRIHVVIVGEELGI
ncbi:MAG: lactate utilization protein [Chloroflexi bacterium]|nr:lactate utilization protein [Chloroflexota bacterium]